MKKAIKIACISLLLAIVLTGCAKELNLKNVQETYKEVKQSMSPEELEKKIGKPSSIKEGEKAISYLYYDGALIVDFRNDRVSAKEIAYNSNKKKNIRVGSELETEIEDLNKLIGKISEGMSFKEVEEILGDKYIQTIVDWHYEYRTYTWYDKNENRVDIEFNSNGNVEYINEIISFSGDVL